MNPVRKRPEKIGEHKRNHIRHRQEFSVNIHVDLQILRIEHGERIHRRNRKRHRGTETVNEQIIRFGIAFAAVGCNRREHPSPFGLLRRRILPFPHLQAHVHESDSVHHGDRKEQNLRMRRRESEEPEIEQDSAEQGDDAEQSVEPSEQRMRHHVVDQRAEDGSGDHRAHLEHAPEDSESPQNDRIFRNADPSGHGPSDRRAVGESGDCQGRHRSCQSQIRDPAPPATPAAVRVHTDHRSENESEHAGQRDNHQRIEKIARSVGLEHQLDQLEDGTALDRIGEVAQQQQTEQRHNPAEGVGQRSDGPLPGKVRFSKQGFHKRQGLSVLTVPVSADCFPADSADARTWNRPGARRDLRQFSSAPFPEPCSRDTGSMP